MLHDLVFMLSEVLTWPAQKSPHEVIFESKQTARNVSHMNLVMA